MVADPWQKQLSEQDKEAAAIAVPVPAAAAQSWPAVELQSNAPNKAVAVAAVAWDLNPFLPWEFSISSFSF